MDYPLYTTYFGKDGQGLCSAPSTISRAQLVTLAGKENSGVPFVRSLQALTRQFLEDLESVPVLVVGRCVYNGHGPSTEVLTGLAGFNTLRDHLCTLDCGGKWLFTKTDVGLRFERLLTAEETEFEPTPLEDPSLSLEPVFNPKPPTAQPHPLSAQTTLAGFLTLEDLEEQLREALETGPVQGYTLPTFRADFESLPYAEERMACFEALVRSLGYSPYPRPESQYPAKEVTFSIASFEVDAHKHTILAQIAARPSANKE